MIPRRDCDKSLFVGICLWKKHAKTKKKQKNQKKTVKKYLTNVYKDDTICTNKSVIGY